jgi:phosphate-selective porin
MYDAGVNWYVNKKNLKVSLHYVHQTGHGDNGYTDETTFKKGNFVGAGCVMAF